MANKVKRRETKQAVKEPEVTMPKQGPQIQLKDLFAKIGELTWANGTLGEETAQLRQMCASFEQQTKTQAARIAELEAEVKAKK